MKLNVRNDRELSRALNHVRDLYDRYPGGIEIEALPLQRAASDGQVGKLKALFSQLALETGHTYEEIRDHFEAGGPRSRGGNPKPIDDYSSEEASAAIERVYVVAAEQEIVLS